MNTVGDLIKKSYSRLGEEDEDHTSSSDEHHEDSFGAANPSAFRNRSWEQNDHDESPEISRKTLIGTSKHEHNETNDHLRRSSFDEMEDDDWEEEIALRRYNLDYKAEIPSDFRPPEFESLPKRIYMKFLNLRTAARQRHAARLLNMPSETFFYKTHSFCMAICDATDQGIMFAAVCISLWLLIGIVANVGPLYWLSGIFAFVVRVSARRIVERLRGNFLRRHRLRLSSIELGSDISYRENPPQSEQTARTSDLV